MASGIIFAGLWLAVQSSIAIEQVPPPADADTRHRRAQEDSQNVSGSADQQLDEIAQLGRNEGAPPEAIQLTIEKSGGEMNQLGKHDRSTQSAPDLADRKQGFETRVIKVEGADRCSAELLSAKDREYCQRVIENRSAEYAGQKENELTPEQKLLLDRNFKLLDGGTDGAIKRLATGRNSTDNSDDQAVASIVLGGQESAAQSVPAKPAESNLSPETQALLDAIARSLGASPGP